MHVNNNTFIDICNILEDEFACLNNFHSYLLYIYLKFKNSILHKNSVLLTGYFKMPHTLGLYYFDFHLEECNPFSVKTTNTEKPGD